MPKVSVIIPVFNVEQYIGKCAKSLFEQTLDDIEYIFVDDCSPDHSIDIVKGILNEYDSRKNQVTFLRMDSNSGLAKARKFGIEHASGEYLVHCDSDDWVDLYMYEHMYEEAKDKDADVVICDYSISDEVSFRTQHSCHSTDKDTCIRNMIYGKDTLACWNKMFKRIFYERIHFPEVSMGEDFCAVSQLMCLCSRIVYIDKPYYFYRSNPESMTRVYSEDAVIRRFRQAMQNLEIVLDFMKSEKLDAVYSNELSALKLYQKNLLLPLSKQKTYSKMWKETFPEIGISIIFNSNVLLKERIKFILGKLRLYHIFKQA